MFDDLLAALALMLVIEGVLPFLSPAALRRTLRTFGELDDRSLRMVGLASMLSGLALLYVVR